MMFEEDFAQTPLGKVARKRDDLVTVSLDLAHRELLEALRHAYSMGTGKSKSKSAVIRRALRVAYAVEMGKPIPPQ